MPEPISLPRRVLYSAAILLVTLALLEGALSLLPRIYQWSRQDVVAQQQVGSRILLCIGDSVTSGQGLDADASYPRQLAARLSARGQDLAVRTLARPGADSGALPRDVTPNLIRLSDGARPIALVMLGHNDFLDWSGTGARAGFSSGSVEGHGDPREASGWRLVRLLRWFTTAWMEEVPAFKVDASRVSALQERFRRLQRAVLDQRGVLIVLTYAVPGTPPEGMSAQAAAVLRQTIDGQRAVNRVLRSVATGLGAPIIDAEDLIPDAATWDARYFQDNIHLTAEGYALLAERVDRSLGLEGWI